MHIGSSKGQALVEVALSLFMLCLILFGISEFGRAMSITNALNNAARQRRPSGSGQRHFG